MIVIFEGADGVGKSTYARHFSAVTNACLISTPRKVGAVEHDTDFEAHLLSLPEDDLFVLDRHTPSDIAYGIMRGQNIDKYVRSWRRFTASTKVLPVYCYTKPKPIADDLIKLSFRQYCLVHGAYRMLARLENAPYLNLFEMHEATVDNYLQNKLCG